MSYSYAIIHRASRECTIVNGGPGDHVNVVVDIKPSSEERERMKIIDCYEDIETELFEDGPPYKTLRMTFTANKGSVITATYFKYKRGRVKDYVSERSRQAAFKMARFVLWCERTRNDPIMAVEDSVKTMKVGKEKADGEICVICHEEYHAEDMIGTLVCNHSYHGECVKRWMMENKNCPLCRTCAVGYEFC